MIFYEVVKVVAKKFRKNPYQFHSIDKIIYIHIFLYFCVFKRERTKDSRLFAMDYKSVVNVDQWIDEIKPELKPPVGKFYGMIKEVYEGLISGSHSTNMDDCMC